MIYETKVLLLFELGVLEGHLYFYCLMKSVEEERD